MTKDTCRPHNAHYIALIAAAITFPGHLQPRLRPAQNPRPIILSYPLCLQPLAYARPAPLTPEVAQMLPLSRTAPATHAAHPQRMLRIRRPSGGPRQLAHHVPHLVAQRAISRILCSDGTKHAISFGARCITFD